MALGAVTIASLIAVQAQTPGDMLRFSQYNYSFGTARSAAMGGAFTSLGSDLVSLSLNPAGLGMYRSSEFSFSPSVTSNMTGSTFKTQVAPEGFTRDADRTRFSMGSMGAALTSYYGRSPLVSFTFGIGYNKLVDFNTTHFAQNFNNPTSMLDFFAVRATGFTPDQLGASTTANQFLAFERLPFDQWGTILSYQTNMIDPASDSPDETHYFPVLSEGTRVNPTLRLISRGSVGEYSFAGGFNLNDKVFLGISIGIQDIFYKNTNTYTEFTTGNSAEILRAFEYSQSTRIWGTGVNFKFGITLRPSDNLRIGAAIHTPTFTTVHEEHVQLMSSFFNAPNTGLNRSFDSPFLENRYNIQSPTRAMAGVSYIINDIMVISADYERVWYNGLRLRNTGDYTFEQEVKEEVLEFFQVADHVRVGVELAPVRNFFLRAGYAYHDTPLKHDDVIFFNQAVMRSYQNLTGGLGFRVNNVSIDLAYVYTYAQYAPFDVYFTEVSPGFTLDSGTIHSKENRHTVTLSMGVRF